MINGKDFGHHVTVVVHRQTCRSKPVEQAGLPQCLGRPVLPRVVSTGAASHPDDNQISRHGHDSSQ